MTAVSIRDFRANHGLKMIDGTEETYMYEIIGSQMASPYLQREGTTYSIGTWGSDYRHFVKSECPESQQIGIAPKAE